MDTLSLIAKLQEILAAKAKLAVKIREYEAAIKRLPITLERFQGEFETLDREAMQIAAQIAKGE